MSYRFSEDPVNYVFQILTTNTSHFLYKCSGQTEHKQLMRAQSTSSGHNIVVLCTTYGRLLATLQTKVSEDSKNCAIVELLTTGYSRPQEHKFKRASHDLQVLC